MKQKNKLTSIRKYTVIILVSVMLSMVTSCNKYLGLPLPADTIAGPTVFTNDSSVGAYLTGNFANLFGSGLMAGAGSIGFTTGLYSDELVPLSPANFQALYTDNINGGDVQTWSTLYARLYTINDAIGGILSSRSDLYYKNQWLGESYFTRALLYFYLTNLYGDVAMPLSNSLIINNTLPRVSSGQVYGQIIADLTKAQGLLSVGYADGNGAATTNRIRPNQAAATALLARVYLYTRDWLNAEKSATTVINNTTYQLVPPAQTFLTSSKESIWSLALAGTTPIADFSLYTGSMPANLIPPQVITSYGVGASLSMSLISQFEIADSLHIDTRYTNWIRQTTINTVPAVTYYFPNKFKSASSSGESIPVLRLAEQYLIRAEARAEQNNLSGAQADINMVRARANLPGTTATTQAELLAAITKERQTEFFAEMGHRYLDLKRTGTIDELMGKAAPLKGGTWSSFKQYWPIPPADILQDPNLKQTPGYKQ